MNDAMHQGLDEVDELFAMIRAAERGAARGEKLAHAWQSVGMTKDDIAAWIRAGVFDPRRAGILVAAGISAHEIDGLEGPHGLPLGYAFSVDRVGVGELLERVTRRRLARSNA